MSNNYNVIMHDGSKKSKSKYAGGFKNGKNTSAYNHDYYIKNKFRWLDNKKSHQVKPTQSSDGGDENAVQTPKQFTLAGSGGPKRKVHTRKRNDSGKTATVHGREQYGPKKQEEQPKPKPEKKKSLKEKISDKIDSKKKEISKKITTKKDQILGYDKKQAMERAQARFNKYDTANAKAKATARDVKVRYHLKMDEDLPKTNGHRMSIKSAASADKINAINKKMDAIDNAKKELNRSEEARTKAFRQATEAKKAYEKSPAYIIDKSKEKMSNVKNASSKTMANAKQKIGNYLTMAKRKVKSYKDKKRYEQMVLDADKKKNKNLGGGLSVSFEEATLGPSTGSKKKKKKK